MNRLHLPVIERPTNRSQCRDGQRPCPWVSCRYHLLVDVTEDGRPRKNFPFEENDEDGIAAAILAMPETCALDVADRGAHFLEDVGEILGVSLERTRQVEERALERICQSGVDIEDPGDHPDDPYLSHMSLDHGDATYFKRWLKRERLKNGR